jgi:hypothetical protein
MFTAGNFAFPNNHICSKIELGKKESGFQAPKICVKHG